MARVAVPISFQYLDVDGTLIPIPDGTAVTIFDRDTMIPAVLYAGESGPSTNAAITDSGGNIEGWLNEGSYSFTAAANASPPGGKPAYAGATIAWEAVRGDGVGYVANGVVGAAQIATGAINLTHLAAALAQFLIPTGAILDYGGNTAPNGFALCQGQVFSRTNPTYANLFGVIGTVYNNGGESTSQFRLPNLQQRFAMGKGESNMPFPRISTGQTLGETGGAIDHAHVIEPLTVNSHNHALSSLGGAQISLTDDFGVILYQGGSGPNYTTIYEWATGQTSGWLSNALTKASSPLTGHTDTASTTTMSALSDTQNPSYLVVQKIIKL